MEEGWTELADQETRKPGNQENREPGSQETKQPGSQGAVVVVVQGLCGENEGI